MTEVISYTVEFRPSKTALFDWTFFRLDSSGPSSYRQSSRFYSFGALPRGGWREGVLLYCCMAVENRLAALSAVLRAFFAATRASRATNLRSSGLVALGSAESHQSYVRGIALSREPQKLQQG